MKAGALNARFVLSSRLCGWGRNGIEMTCAMLNLAPLVSGHSFDHHAKCIADILTDMATI